ncbi:hypothetical protein GGTG_10120 [Gaeumannomyces tritici R3-111a-1]|uniref:Uncharacterized protein n=1 Tax=Gaeumannomyces tritici (strain R3-111a-1) TaxID=644352 RepID=J3P9D8_GAET3|nr:hypothetical protein GGTG_10120 [Gaeumannomyces tritici R3-111a-1]EJT73274.1 hypothetical protein GGTG_10120 [Gaeumannomyces tritici R3-111a-1]
MLGAWVEVGEDHDGTEADREPAASNGGADYDEGYELGESQHERGRALMVSSPSAPVAPATGSEDGEDDGGGSDDVSITEEDFLWHALQEEAALQENGLQEVAALDPSDSGSSTISRPTSHDRRSPSPRELQPSQPFTRRNAVTSTDILQLFPDGEDGRLAWRVVASHEWG